MVRVGVMADTRCDGGDPEISRKEIAILVEYFQIRTLVRRADHWVSRPRGGGLPEIHDEASGYEHPEPDEDLIDLAHEDLGAFAGLKYI